MPLLNPVDKYDHQLIGNVHPPNWSNPQPAKRYNLVVVGAGTAGLVCAAAAAGLGAKVALIERGLMGGDCLNFGCVPSKALLRAARASSDAGRAGEFGVAIQVAPEVDFSVVMQRMRKLRAALSGNDSASRFNRLGVDVFVGDGRFSSGDSFEVGGQSLRFSRAVIATGSRAAHLPVPGFESTGFITNENIFSLTALPRRLVVVGGGPVGCELAQAFRRFGSLVTLLEVEPRILPREDSDAAQIVKDALVRDGIEVIENCRIQNAQIAEDGKIINLEGVFGHRGITFDEMLVAAGRVPAVDGLGLEAAGVDYDRRTGVMVDDHLRTTNWRVFAAGDVCSAYKFTHVADAMARIVIRNALFRGRERVSSLTIPWCTYTDPEIARVGLDEADARRQNIPVQTFVQPLGEVDRAVLDGESEGFLKVQIRRGSDKIIGATLVARHAGEMISELTLAIAANVGLTTIARTIHPYPTQAEAVRKIGDNYNRTRLTPRVKWLLRQWLTWTR